MFTLQRYLIVIFLLIISIENCWSEQKQFIPLLREPLRIQYSVEYVVKALPIERIAEVRDQAKSNPTAGSAKSLAYVNSRIADKSLPATTCEYLFVSPIKAQYISKGKATRIIVKDGSIWTLTQGKGMAIAKESTTGARYSGAYRPGMFSEEIPYLGFMQPGKIYQSGKPTMLKTEEGFQITSKFPHSYIVDPNTKKPSTVVSVMTYDNQGNLIKFQTEKNRFGVFKETYEYKDFVNVADGIKVPKTIVKSRRFSDIAGYPEFIDDVTTYTVKSFSRKPALTIAVKSPAKGTYIQDYRYSKDGISDIVGFTFSGKNSFDTESLNAYNKQKAQSKNAQSSVPVMNKPFDFTLKDLSGKTIKLSDYRGKVVVVDVWATWCPPCRKEIPGLIEYQNEIEASNLPVKIIGVSIDSDYAALTKFVPNNSINYTVSHIDWGVNNLFGKINAIPQKFIFDANGVFVENIKASMEKKDLIAVVNRYTKNIKPEPKKVTAKPSLLLNQPFEFNLTDVSDNQIKLSDYRGNVVVVDVWATWCPPCVKEIPILIETQKEMISSNKAVKFLGVSIDTNKNALINFLKGRTFSYPIVHMLVDKDFPFGRMKGGIPQKFIFDSNGVFVENIIGTMEKQELLDTINKYK